MERNLLSSGPVNSSLAVVEEFMVKIALTSPSAASKLVHPVEHEVSVLTGLLPLNIQAAYQ